MEGCICGLCQTDIFGIYLSFSERPLHTRCWLSNLRVTSFNHHNNERHGLWTIDNDQSHFPDGNTEAQRRKMSHTGAHTEEAAELGFKLKTLESCLLCWRRSRDPCCPAPLMPHPPWHLSDAQKISVTGRSLWPDMWKHPCPV